MAQIIDVPGQGQVEFPDGMDDAAIVSAIQGMSGQKAPPKTSMLRDIAQGAQNVGSGLVRGAGSIGSTILAPYDIAKDLAAGKGLSLESNRQRRADIDYGLEAAGADPNSLLYQGGKIAGEIAGTAGVPGVLAKGAQALKATPAIVEALRGAGTVGSLPARIASGAAAGGTAAGLVNPEDAGIGAAFGGAIPAVGGAYRFGKSLVEPLSQSGREKIIGRALRNFAGGEADTALQKLQNARELVPGSMPTVGQASGVPSLAALERTATAIDPNVSNQMAARIAAQNEARQAALSGVAGDDLALKALKDARGDAAQVAYGKARTSDAMRRSMAIDDAMLSRSQNAGLGSLANLPKQSEAQAVYGAVRPSKGLEDLAKRPAFQNVINQAKTMAANQGLDIGNPLTSIDGLHYIKIALDDALEFNPSNPLGRNAKSALMGIKESLLKEMDEISPVYGASREAYSQASKPVTQMEIGQEIAKRAINPLTGQIQPQAFARSLSDETAQRVSGMPGATLQGMVQPQELAALNAIKDDLARAQFAQTAGRGVGSDTVQKLAYTNMLDQAGIPQFLRGFGPAGVVGNLAQKAGQVVYKDANERLAAQLAESMLNPQEAARLMQGSVQSGNVSPLIEALRQGVYRTAPVAAAQ